MKFRIFMLAFAATVALAIPASAAGRFHSTVTIHLPPDFSAGYFYGVVRSIKPACERGRNLRIVRDPDGRSGYSPYVSGIRTNGDGTWTFHANPYVIDGYYKAVIARMHVRGGVCATAISKPFFVD